MQATDTVSYEWKSDQLLMLDAVREAGKIARDFFLGKVRAWEKSPNNPVSEADYAVDDLLKERLHKNRPNYGWVSEESEQNKAREGSQAVWVVDPIDGTRAFIQKKPQFAISVALLVDCVPTLGVVYNPATEECFEAARGHGARLNGKNLQVSRHQKIVGSKLLSSRHAFRDCNWSEAAEGASFSFISSIAYRMALVAAGTFDATITLSTKSDWDIAAGDLIVQEAGGLVTQVNGTPLVYGQDSLSHPHIVAAGPHLHKTLTKGLGMVPEK